MSSAMRARSRRRCAQRAAQDVAGAILDPASSVRMRAPVSAIARAASTAGSLTASSGSRYSIVAGSSTRIVDPGSGGSRVCRTRGPPCRRSVRARSSPRAVAAPRSRHGRPPRTAAAPRSAATFARMSSPAMIDRSKRRALRPADDGTGHRVDFFNRELAGRHELDRPERAEHPDAIRDEPGRVLRDDDALAEAAIGEVRHALDHRRRRCLASESASSSL